MKLLEKLITKPKKLQRILGLQKEQLRLLIARMSPSWETDWAMGNIFKNYEIFLPMPQKSNVIAQRIMKLKKNITPVKRNNIR